jgi:hypothetical protein
MRIFILDEPNILSNTALVQPFFINFENSRQVTNYKKVPQ